MFKKKSNSEDRVDLSKKSTRTGPSIISVDMVVNGNIVSGGTVQIEGALEGDIRASSVVIGDQATVSGEIIAEDIVIRGRVIGQIRGVKVVLASGSHVEGNVLHESLAIETGAFFDGQSKNSENPLSNASIQPQSNVAKNLDDISDGFSEFSEFSDIDDDLLKEDDDYKLVVDNSEVKAKSKK